MRRLFVAVLAGMTLFVSPHTPNAYAKVRDPQAQCRTSDGNGWSPTDVKQAIDCAVNHWSVPGGRRKAKSVARCESGFNPRARYTDHLGVYQHVSRYWPARFRAHRVHGWHMHSSVFNARSNVVVSIRMAHAGGWGPWACA
jgi:hypothetical protein